MNPDVYRRVLAGETLTFVLSQGARWRLTGPDNIRYLNGQVTNDVAALKDGEVCYAAVCTAKGRMEGDLHITLHGTDLFIDSDATLRETLGPRLEKYLIADDAVLEDITEMWSLSHVFGPAIPEAPADGFVVRHDRFGLPGHDIWMATTGAAVAGDSVDSSTLEILLLEQGIPRWGAELTSQTLPPEAGPHLLDSISYTKGCYVGQETIARLKSVGHVNRSLVFLVTEAIRAPVPGTKLIHHDREVGTITSAGFSPRLEKNVALGYVHRDAMAEGTSLQADTISLIVAQPLVGASGS